MRVGRLGRSQASRTSTSPRPVGPISSPTSSLARANPTLLRGRSRPDGEPDLARNVTKSSRSCVNTKHRPEPAWDCLHETAVARDRRGACRLVHFPAGEREDLAVIWPWSDRVGVFSHQAALSLHGLSDVMPDTVDVTLPSDWQRRRPTRSSSRCSPGTSMRSCLEPDRGLAQGTGQAAEDARGVRRNRLPGRLLRA